MIHLRRLLRFDPGYLVAAVLPLIGLIPTFGEGIIKTADGPLHVQRIYAMSTLLQHGNLWPRWVPWFHLGYGYPVFNFYPPGVFYLGGLLGLLGISIPLAFNLVAALVWIIGSVGTYALGRRFLPGSAAILAAALWAYAPSRLYEVWDQGSLPQMAAAACVPWIFLGLVLAVQRPSRRSVLALALPLAGMILSHQPITLITALFVAPAAAVLPLVLSSHHRAELLKRYAAVFGGVALGVGLASIFLLPMALELKYVQAAKEAPDVIPYLRSNFLQPGQLFMQPSPQDLTDLRYKLPTTLGLAGGILCLLGLIALIKEKRWGWLLALTAGLAFALFMMVEISLPVWQLVPLMTQLRFPERFLRVASVFIALGGGAFLLLLPSRWRSGGLAVGFIVTVVAALPMVYPNHPFINWANLSALDEIRMEETEFTWGSTSYDEFNPMWGEKPGWEPAVEPEEYVTNPLRIVVNRLDMIRQWPDLQVEQVDTAAVQVTVSGTRPVRFRQFYFPGWSAMLDGQPVEIYPDDELGEITVNVPEGTHTVTLAYTGTTVQTVGTLVTLVSLGLVFALAFVPQKFFSRRLFGARLPYSYQMKDKPLTPPPDPLPEFREGEMSGRYASPEFGGGWEGVKARVIFYLARYGVRHVLPLQTEVEKTAPLTSRAAGIMTAGVVAFALVNSLVLSPNMLLFRYQSPPDTPVYMQTPVHLAFGDTFELLGYNLEQNTVAPGEPISITLFWRALHEMDKEYRPIVQLVNLSQTAAWAASEPFFPSGGKTTTYTPERFASDIHTLRPNANTPPYLGRISVQMVDAGSGEALRMPDGSDRLVLNPLLRITGMGADLPRILGYQFDGTIELACAAITHDGDQLRLQLGWHVLRTPEQDVTLFIHGLDAEGNMIAQNDQPPFGQDYPASLWQPGQNLLDGQTLPWKAEITAVAIGLYTPDRRLTVTHNDQPVPDNRIILPLDENSCVR
ncbi:MAG TPA: 6-pyruvoyl-tetrahydropterin synthase-related protein [Phototrophicaceae bacterium]|nr:6-pyruvoyl-tetrahydropterin synthase-related protein [Phototrophicaceae bacterium]